MKFSELTIDMFRMLQALEREPVNLATQTSKQGVLVSGSPGRSQAQTFQPHLLHQPQHPASGAPSGTLLVLPRCLPTRLETRGDADLCG